MNANKRILAGAEILLMLPALLFMSALVLRGLPHGYGLAQTAQQVVDWYAGKMWTLWVLLLVLPLTVLVTGCGALLSSWNDGLGTPRSASQMLGSLRADLSTFFVLLATLTAAVVLVIVILHMLAN